MRVASRNKIAERQSQPARLNINLIPSHYAKIVNSIINIFNCKAVLEELPILLLS